MAQKKLTRQEDQKHIFNFVWPNKNIQIIKIYVTQVLVLGGIDQYDVIF